jgi:hypothetical protein
MTEQEILRPQRWRLKIIKHSLEVSKNVAKTCGHYCISRQSYYRWYQRLLEFGEDGLKDHSKCPKSIRTLKAEDEFYIAALFELLHAPPSELGINRTSWKTSKT